jgi:hypothetical protein
MARPILLATGFCLSEVAVMKNYDGERSSNPAGNAAYLILDVDKVPSVLDSFDVCVGDRVLRVDTQ